MNDRLRRVLVAVAALFAVVSLAVSPVAAQTAAVSRAFDGHPDLNGVWQASDRYGALGHSGPSGERRARRYGRDRRDPPGPGRGGRQ